MLSLSPLLFFRLLPSCVVPFLFFPICFVHELFAASDYSDRISVSAARTSSLSDLQMYRWSLLCSRLRLCLSGDYLFYYMYHTV